ncbi:MAG: SdrD B-like domain-containing protein [Pseudomonadota bacterium]|nr:SdrD B-like domain-containing protein [Pseudomonadota bacterium]
MPDTNVEIGEECSFHIETGGWFGFQTPGFDYIAVQRIQVVDQLPDGQGYISSTDPTLTSDPEILGISLNPPPAPLDEGNFDWTFNQNVPAERITVRDKWFQADATTRILNDALNSRTAPNLHAATSSNILVSTFEAVFSDAGTEEVYTLGPSTVGYPQESVRRVDLTVTEPNILVTKEVCNENLYGTGTGCSNFVDSADDGDTQDSYIYRVTLTNEASSSGVDRAPAYNIASTDLLDSSDLVYVIPFNNDGLDNDGDGLIDGADTDGEGSISDNTVENGTPPTITTSHTHSDALLKLDAGSSVTFYYRVDPDDTVAPLQTLTNTVSADYDSLEGDSGNQTVSPGDTGELGGARSYTSADASATVQILPLETQPKSILQLSNTPISGAPQQAVSVGEEVEYELRASIPVANLRNFVIRDELPAGIDCSEAPVINLDAPPYSEAGFSPGGQFTPTCTDSLVEWNFGDQELTAATSNNRFEFPVTFIARVENILDNVDGTTISNGDPATVARLSYVDDAGSTQSLDYDQVDLVVREPAIALSKSFAVANSDAADVLTVTVTATNTGSATAYNLQVLDDLVGSSLTYLGNPSGADPPDMVDTTTLGANRPIFKWNSSNPDYAIDVGETRTFTFDVRVDIGAEPHEILDNTLQGRWTSLPGQSTALNSSGSIGSDGSADGLRNGALPNAGDTLNDYETTATAQTVVPALTISKTDLDTSVEPVIGALKHFQIEVTLPEGTTQNLNIIDDLAFSGLDYVLENNSTYDVSYTFQGIATINGQSPGESAFNSYPADGATGTATWDIGTVVTNSEDDTTVNAIDPVIRINLYARIADDPATASGGSLQNQATVTYLNGESGASESLSDTTAAINVVEPDLTLSKSGPGQLQLGIPGTFTLDVQNVGSSTAWDITLSDQLPNLDPSPGGMCDSAPTSITAQVFESDGSTPVSGVLTEGSDYTVDFTAAPDCTLTITFATAAASVEPNQRLIVTYQAELDVDTPQSESMTNVAGATEWYSLDTDGSGAVDENRTYSRSLSDGTTGTVDHEDAHTITSELPVLEFRKVVENVTSGQNPASNAEPGDTLRYTVTVTNISDVPLTDFTLRDELDRLNSSQDMFAAGTLNLVSSLPTGATDSSDSNGGSSGTGLLLIENLDLDAQGDANDSLSFVYEVDLAPVITSGSQVLNQAQLIILDSLTRDSDDPNINGTDDPNTEGDEDPTAVTVDSAPAFEVWKSSQDLTGDPDLLEAGDTLRYTITVQNVGTENTVNVTLTDQIPGNTGYVANSTTLNGSTVADPSAGVSALQNGMLINAPEDTTAGFLRAESGGTTNIATITFDVVVDSNAVDGTVIANQGIVTGDGQGSGSFNEEPSDDPSTSQLDDPTIDVVGNVPLIDSQKTVVVDNDVNGNGLVDPGDSLRYTITVSNLGALPATNVVLTDPIPADTSYVAGTTTLNGSSVADPSAGTSALESGMPVSSADLTPPLPTAGNGTLTAGEQATVTFDVQVNAGTAVGTLISNQGTVSTNELPDELTDWDGNDANGDQPTVVVVGNVQQLSITKEVNVVGGGAAEPGDQLEYVIRVTNYSGVAASNVVITDNLDLPVAGQLNYVAGSGSMNGSSSGVSFSDPILTADYAATYGDLQPGNTIVLRFRAAIDSSLALGTTITNTGQVDWDSPTRSETASVSIDVGGTPGVAGLSGRLWHDADFDTGNDSGETSLAGWTVDFYRNGSPFASTTTDSDGDYQFNGIAPNDVSGDSYELRFAAPNAGSNTASLGLTDSPFTDGQQRISNIVVTSGSNTPNLNLPAQPNGVTYDAVLRTPVAGASLVMLRASDSLQLPASCFDDPAQQGQVTLANGYYKFGLNFSQPECTPGDDYLIQVTAPGNGYTAAPSQLIPATTDGSTAAFDVPSCPGTASDAIPATASHCEAQTSAAPQPFNDSGSTAGTSYYLKLTLNNTLTPGHSELFNNHIPLDPELGAAVAVSKVSAKVNVTRSDLVPYTITLNNTLPAPLAGLNVVDTFPPGFKYVSGSSRVNDSKREPIVNGRQLTWSNLIVPANSSLTIKMLLVVGAGVGEGEYINRVQVFNNVTGSNVSGEARATVRVVADPTFDCSDIIGKVFDDRNHNGYQDEGEAGLPSARVATARGLVVTTDEHGRFHITCAIVPNRDRGSNFIVKLDERSLPSGYRVTTENPRVKRITRGKIVKFNFGASVHRVIRLDLADAVFEPQTTQMRPQWIPRLDLLIEQLNRSASILRLSYLAENETEDLVEDRLEAVQEMVEARWQDQYKLRIETEVFWRSGGPDAGGDL